MKVKCIIKYPTWYITEDEIEVDVPEGADPDDYIYKNFCDIVEKHGCDPLMDVLANAFDVDMAGYEILKGERDEN